MDIDAIERKLKARGISQTELARHLGIHPSGVNRIFNGGRQLKAAELQRISELLGETPGGIPIIGLVTAGNWREAVRDSVASMPRLDPSIPNDAFALQVDGDSMDLVAPDGTTVIVDPNDKDLFPGRYYVVSNGGDTTFKQFKADPARLAPCSSNPAHRDIPLGTGEPFEIVGRVIWQASRM